MRKARRAIAEARVQRGQFQPLHKFENGSRALADEREDVEKQRKECNRKAEQKRDARAPPCLEQLVEAESAPLLGAF